MSSSVRVRFAPSPTGSLHLGGARTALYNYLFAKHMAGTFILRVEDTDLDRSTEQAMRTQLEDLTWLGLRWDEGIDPKTLDSFGDKGPYRQSQRLEHYNDFAQKLIDQGQAYYCFLTDDQIDAQKAQSTDQHAFQIQSPYKDMLVSEAKAKLAAGEKACLRFKMPEQMQTIAFDDLIRGEVSFPSNMVGDFVIMRSNGMPVYNFCCVVDDILMQISHVFRAEEHLSNTLRQLLLYQAFSHTPPIFAHASMILGEDRKKLSKRHGAVCVDAYQKQGFLPQAIINAIALLGWTHPEGKEIFDMQTLIDVFDPKDLNAAAAICDEKKMRWINQKTIQALDLDSLHALCLNIFAQHKIAVPDKPNDWWQRAYALFAPQMETLENILPLISDLSNYKLAQESEEVFTWETTASVLQAWQAYLASQEAAYLTQEAFSAAVKLVQTQSSVKGKALFMPLRLAVSGCTHGSELKQLVCLIPTDELKRRVQHCLTVLA
jgi:nondiscriminating glutamyl-tRNA synthetase